MTYNLGFPVNVNVLRILMKKRSLSYGNEKRKQCNTVILRLISERYTKVCHLCLSFGNHGNGIVTWLTRSPKRFVVNYWKVIWYLKLSIQVDSFYNKQSLYYIFTFNDVIEIIFFLHNLKYLGTKTTFLKKLYFLSLYW